MSSVIVVDQLTKWYGARLAVDRVSLEVRAGEVLGLLGPNGSGKPTILRILTGYLRPSSGTVSVAGLDISDDALAVKRRVGYVPENAPLYDLMRVREFLELMARIKGAERASVSAAVDGVCGRLDLTEVARRQIGTLSKGFRQRVAVALVEGGFGVAELRDEPVNLETLFLDLTGAAPAPPTAA